MGRARSPVSARSARPDVGVVTAVAAAHTARLGGIDGVARAKAELVAALPPTGTAVLNADDPLVAAMAGATPARVITFGSGDAADVRIVELTLDDTRASQLHRAYPLGRRARPPRRARCAHGVERGGGTRRRRTSSAPTSGWPPRG